MTQKKFRIPAKDVLPLAKGYGACIASDKITVEGFAVGYMYREAPDFAEDGGWRFLSGTEDDAYMDDAANQGLYDVNTIANYDRSIIPHLDAPEGSAFTKAPGAADFTRVPPPEPPAGGSPNAGPHVSVLRRFQLLFFIYLGRLLQRLRR